jgi:hypothetical protein
MSQTQVREVLVSKVKHSEPLVSQSLECNFKAADLRDRRNNASSPFVWGWSSYGAEERMKQWLDIKMRYRAR